MRHLKFTAGFWASLLTLERSVKSPEFWSWSNALGFWGFFFLHQIRKGQRYQRKCNRRLKPFRCDKIKKWGWKCWLVLSICVNHRGLQVYPDTPATVTALKSFALLDQWRAWWTGLMLNALFWIFLGGLRLARCCHNSCSFTNAQRRPTLLVLVKKKKKKHSSALVQTQAESRLGKR